MQARAARQEFLGTDAFHDPGWNMLLALFAALGHRTMTVTDLCPVSGVPAAIALRYMRVLERDGLLIEGKADEGKRASVRLSAKGLAAYHRRRERLVPELIARTQSEQSRDR